MSIIIIIELPGMQFSHQLTASIKSKCTPDEVLNILSNIPNPLAEDTDMEADQPTHNPLAIDVFVQVLLNLGAKSFSHSFAAIAKYDYYLFLIDKIYYDA